MNAEQKIANALRSIAKELAQQWKRGERSSDVSLDDLTEVLLQLADRISK